MVEFHLYLGLLQRRIIGFHILRLLLSAGETAVQRLSHLSVGVLSGVHREVFRINGEILRRIAKIPRRRLQILQDGPPSFFYDGDGRPRRAAAEPDPYRRGMTLIAAAARREEIAWLRRILSDGADAAEAGAAEANADVAVSADAAEAGAGPRSTDTDDRERT